MRAPSIATASCLFLNVVGANLFHRIPVQHQRRALDSLDGTGIDSLSNHLSSDSELPHPITRGRDKHHVVLAHQDDGASLRRRELQQPMASAGNGPTAPLSKSSSGLDSGKKDQQAAHGDAHSKASNKKSQPKKKQTKKLTKKAMRAQQAQKLDALARKHVQELLPIWAKMKGMHSTLGLQMSSYKMFRDMAKHSLSASRDCGRAIAAYKKINKRSQAQKDSLRTLLKYKKQALQMSNEARGLKSKYGPKNKSKSPSHLQSQKSSSSSSSASSESSGASTKKGQKIRMSPSQLMGKVKGMMPRVSKATSSSRSPGSSSSLARRALIRRNLQQPAIGRQATGDTTQALPAQEESHHLMAFHEHLRQTLGGTEDYRKAMDLSELNAHTSHAILEELHKIYRTPAIHREPWREYLENVAAINLEALDELEALPQRPLPVQERMQVHLTQLNEMKEIAAHIQGGTQAVHDEMHRVLQEYHASLQPHETSPSMQTALMHARKAAAEAAHLPHQNTHADLSQATKSESGEQDAHSMSGLEHVKSDQVEKSATPEKSESPMQDMSNGLSTSMNSDGSVNLQGAQSHAHESKQDPELHPAKRQKGS